MSAPIHPFGFSSGNREMAKTATPDLEAARRQVAEFREVEAALNKARAVQARADGYAREMRPHGLVWDVERKVGRYLTTTENKLIGFQAGMIVGALIGVGAAIVTLFVLCRAGGGTL